MGNGESSYRLTPATTGSSGFLHSPFPIPHYDKKGCEDVNKKQKNLLLRIIIAAVFFVPLYLISEDIVHVNMPQWALIVLFLIPYLTVGNDILRKAAPPSL